MKLEWFRRRHGNGGTFWSIALLIAALLVLCLVITSCGKQKAESAQGNEAHITSEPAQSMPGKVMQHSMGVECQSNLNQIRMLIDNAKNEDPEGKLPASLQEIPEAARISTCPISHKPYLYDAATGRVWCEFPGHEKF